MDSAKSSAVSADLGPPDQIVGTLAKRLAASSGRLATHVLIDVQALAVSCVGLSTPNATEGAMPQDWFFTT
jgi:hypothetical protein